MTDFSLIERRENTENKTVKACEGETIMKKKIIGACMAFAVLISSLPIGSFAAEDTAKNFYIKKNGNKTPILSSDLALIQKYGALYIDINKAKACEKVVYLTFDAGYENGNVEKTLDTLKEENVTGAFFILGHIIRSNGELVRRMAEEGHAVCNHTENHKDMTTLTTEEMKANLLRLEAEYEKCTGKKMERIFRFPEGRFSEQTLKTAKELGYTTVFWSLAYADWDNENQPKPDAAKKLLTENIHDGAIILLHPTSGTNAEILGDLIREWKALGYRFGDIRDITVNS